MMENPPMSWLNGVPTPPIQGNMKRTYSDEESVVSFTQQDIDELKTDDSLPNEKRIEEITDWRKGACAYGFLAEMADSRVIDKTRDYMTNKFSNKAIALIPSNLKEIEACILIGNTKDWMLVKYVEGHLHEKHDKNEIMKGMRKDRLAIKKKVKARAKRFINLIYGEPLDISDAFPDGVGKDDYQAFEFYMNQRLEV